MKRRHTRADIIAFCEEVRRLRPDAVFGADLIAGFPTEDEAMFQNTLGLVDDAGLTWLQVFPFSPRKGTPAARMPQVDRRVAKARAARLRIRGEAAVAAHHATLVGSEQVLLMETTDAGRTPSFAFARVGTPSTPGAFRMVRI